MTDRVPFFGKEPCVSCKDQTHKCEIHKIRELASSSELLLKRIHTFENAADMLTKPVTTQKFKHCLDLINISKC